MTAAVIILAAALAASVAGLIALGAWLRTAYRDAGELRVDLAVEMRRGDQLQDERDAATVDVAKLTTDVHELERRLAAAETQRNAAVAKEAEHVGETIRNAPDAVSALDALNRELQTPLVPAGGTPDPTASGR